MCNPFGAYPDLPRLTPTTYYLFVVDYTYNLSRSNSDPYCGLQCTMQFSETIRRSNSVCAAVAVAVIASGSDSSSHSRNNSNGS